MTDLPEFEFRVIARQLYALGYRGLLPLVPWEKRPGVNGWQRWNNNVQTIGELDWLINHVAQPGGGVGMCAGNQLVGFDLDIRDLPTVTRAQEIIESIAGPTQLVRVGLAPKTMLFYRSHAPKLRRNPMGMSIEIYPGGHPASGQVVLTGVHPDTYLHYLWPRQHPLQVPVVDVAAIKKPKTIDEITRALAADPLIQQYGMAVKAGTTASGNKAQSGWMQDTQGITPAAAKTEIAEHGLAGLSRWVASTGAGARHYAAVAAVKVVLSMGLDPDQEAEVLEDIERGFYQAKGNAGYEWARLLQWAHDNDYSPAHTRNQLRARLRLPQVEVQL